MFQYAYGRALGLETGYEFKMDNSYYIHYSEVTADGYTYKRDYGLNQFNIVENLATEDEVNKIINIGGGNRFSLFFNRKRNERAPYYQKRTVKELDTVFDPNLLRVRDNSYIEGYFTSERYFAKHRDIILREFTLKSSPDAENATIIKRMQETESVCISIEEQIFWLLHSTMFVAINTIWMA